MERIVFVLGPLFFIPPKLEGERIEFYRESLPFLFSSTTRYNFLLLFLSSLSFLRTDSNYPTNQAVSSLVSVV